MSKLEVNRSTHIARPRAELVNSLVDFSRWPLWSPWLCQEPSATIKYQGETGEPGSGYAWDGVRVGAGNMRLLSRSESNIHYDLTFLKPWKSIAKVGFELEAIADNETRLTWSMQSSLPFFLFFMRNSFETFVGMDYERGLRMLKELEETGEVRSQSDLADEPVPLAACSYIARDGQGTLAGLGPAMDTAYPELEQEAENAGLVRDGPAFCHYTRMNPMKDRWEYTMGVPVKPGATSNSLTLRQRAPIQHCVHVTHTGHYAHLGNAWATAFGAMRNRKQRHDRSNGGIEIYRQTASSSDSGDAITDIYVPLR